MPHLESTVLIGALLSLRDTSSAFRPQSALYRFSASRAWGWS